MSVQSDPKAGSLFTAMGTPSGGAFLPILGLPPAPSKPPFLSASWPGSKGPLALQLTAGEGRGKGWGLGDSPQLGVGQGQPLGRDCVFQRRPVREGETESLAGDEAFSPMVLGVRGEFMAPAQT